MPHSWSLTIALTRREIEQRYRGSYGGLSWYVLQTLLSVGVYSLVFGTIFSTRWAETGREPTSFTMALFLGLLFFNLFSECILRSSSLMITNVNYVKKLVFPLRILPIVAIAASLFNMMVGLAVFFVAAGVIGVPIATTALLLPVIIAPFALLTLGLMWFLASIGTFVRDTTHIIGLIIMMMMFLSPLFYPTEILPAELRNLIVFNPISLPMEMARAAVLFGKFPNFVSLAIYSFVACAVTILGYMWFESTRKGFSDVL
jgi:homopolymeric O-antigen transport system permease protein